jgi:hypothetical protein
MSKITDYKILIADDIPQLVKEVKEHLDHGWVPLGGPFAVVVVREGPKKTESREEITFSQAMTYSP